MNMVYFRIYAFAAVAMLLVISSACHHQPTADINFEPQPRTILAKIGLNNTRDPNLTVSSSGVLGLLTVYSDSTGNHVGYTMSHDGGDSFMPIAPVSDPAAKVSAHGESAPALATGGEAIYALWQQRSEKGANQLAVARSLNYGRSFDTPVIVTGDEAPGFHGFASLGVSPAEARSINLIEWRCRHVRAAVRESHSVRRTKSSSPGAKFSMATFATWWFRFPMTADRHLFQKYVCLTTVGI